MAGYLQTYHRVYVLDDHDIVRRGLRDLLVNAKDIRVVGDSGTVAEAIPAILRLDVDVMLLDLQLQDGTGVEVCRAVRAVKPSVRGLLLTASGDDEALAAALLAGAAGSLVKLSRSTDIVGSIRKLRPGVVSLLDPASRQRASRALSTAIESLSPGITEDDRRVLRQVIDAPTGQLTDEPPGPSHLSATEIERLVARVTHALLGRAVEPGERGAGRHRRSD